MQQAVNEETPQASIASRWTMLDSQRRGVLSRAQECAYLTLPSLLPEEGYNESQELPSAYSSFGSYCVNNLASKILLALFPTNVSYFVFRIAEDILQGLEQADAQAKRLAGKNGGAGLRAECEAAMAKQEKILMEDMQDNAVRVKFFHALKLLIATGDALIYSPEKGFPKVYSLNNYVCQRDGEGKVQEIIIRECLTKQALPQKLQDLVTSTHAPVNLNSGVGSLNDVIIYTHVQRTAKGKFKVRQEINDGIHNPEGDGTYTEDNLPWLVLRWIGLDGEHYGRGHVEESIGDLRAYNNYATNIGDYAEACSKIQPLVNPSGTTSIARLNSARKGQYVQGRADDVSFLRVDKLNDFGVVQKTAEEVKQDLRRAFLLNSVVQRQAERVTAEEVKVLANELEDHLGGVYSVLSQEFQYPYLRLRYNQLQTMKKLPSLPKGTVKPVITTGLAALGRGNDLARLQTFVNLVGNSPEGWAYLNMRDLVTRMGTALGISMDGLVKTEEEIQQEKAAAMQQQQQQQMVETIQKGVPAAAGALVKAATGQNAPSA